MAKTKYEIENSIVMKGVFNHLLQQVDFEIDEIRDVLRNYPCHIYMICSRPRITIDPKSIKINKRNYSFTFIKHYQEKVIKVKCKFKNKFNFRSYKLSDSCNRISIFGDNGELLSEGKTSLLYYPFCIKEYDNVLDLNILYIGQAFGENGERLASDRLISHNTLQAIYSDFSDKKPTDEIWLILWQFAPYYISMMGGVTNGASIGFDESYKQLEKVLGENISFDQKITITEAILIRHFLPIYNKEYKTTFPKSYHSSYKFCYNLDLNSACFELETINLFTRLYSDNIKPNIFHVGMYPLHSEDERKNVFNIDTMFK
jgi:hypothetical protein